MWAEETNLKPLLKVAPQKENRRKFICDIRHEREFFPLTTKNSQQLACGAVALICYQRAIKQGILEELSDLPPRIIPSMPSLIVVGPNDLVVFVGLKPSVKIFSKDNTGSHNSFS